jgi:hypothetical protein
MKRLRHYHRRGAPVPLRVTNGGASKAAQTVVTRSSVSLEIDWEPTKFELFFVPPYFSPSVALRELIDGLFLMFFKK